MANYQFDPHQKSAAADGEVFRYLEDVSPGIIDLLSKASGYDLRSGTVEEGLRQLAPEFRPIIADADEMLKALPLPLERNRAHRIIADARSTSRLAKLVEKTSRLQLSEEQLAQQEVVKRFADMTDTDRFDATNQGNVAIQLAQMVTDAHEIAESVGLPEMIEVGEITSLRIDQLEVMKAKADRAKGASKTNGARGRKPDQYLHSFCSKVASTGPISDTRLALWFLSENHDLEVDERTVRSWIRNWKESGRLIVPPQR